jgi:predicted DNA-binding protein
MKANDPIQQGIEDLEDARLAALALEAHRQGKEPTYSLDEVVSELGLDPEAL